MFRTTLKTLSARKLRLFTTSFAVLLGVAFMAGTLVLTDTIGKTFDKLFADVNKGTDAYVRAEVAFDSEWFGDQRPRLDASLIDQIKDVDGVATAEGHIEAYAQLVDKAGKPIGNPNMGAPVLGAAWLSNDDLNPFDLTSGRPPQADDEVVIDKGSADAADFVVGDSTTVLTQTGPEHVTIVGIAKFGDSDSPAGASYTMFTPTAAQAYLTQPGKIDAIKIVADPGVSETQLVERISQVVPAGTEVLTGDEITKEDQAAIKEDMSFFNVFLMVFAIIALFVGSFIIYNSFSILVAQRTKEMALMRAIGASRRQVTRSVLLEAGVVGLIASALGLAAGVGVAAGLKLLLSGIGIDIPAGGIVLTQQDRDHLDDRRPRCERCLSRVPGTPRRKGSADRGDARGRPRPEQQKPPPCRQWHDHHRPRCARDGRRSVRWRRYRPRRPRCRTGVHRRRRARSRAGPPDQPGHRFAAAPSEGSPRQLGQAERDAQPQAHVGNGRGSDDRCRPRRIHHHPRLVDEGVGRPQRRQDVHG